MSWTGIQKQMIWNIKFANKTADGRLFNYIFNIWNSNFECEVANSKLALQTKPYTRYSLNTDSQSETFFVIRFLDRLRIVAKWIGFYCLIFPVRILWCSSEEKPTKIWFQFEIFKWQNLMNSIWSDSIGYSFFCRTAGESA